jgi:hypothetical protein
MKNLIQEWHEDQKSESSAEHLLEGESAASRATAPEGSFVSASISNDILGRTASSREIIRNIHALETKLASCKRDVDFLVWQTKCHYYDLCAFEEGLADLEGSSLWDDMDLAYCNVQFLSVNAISANRPHSSVLERLRSFFLGLQLSKEPEWSAKLSTAISDFCGLSREVLATAGHHGLNSAENLEAIRRYQSEMATLESLGRQAREEPSLPCFNFQTRMSVYILLDCAKASMLHLRDALSVMDDREALLASSEMLALTLEELEQINMGVKVGPEAGDVFKRLQYELAALREELSETCSAKDCSALLQYDFIKGRLLGPFLRGVLCSLSAPEEQESEVQYFKSQLKSQLEEAHNQVLMWTNEVEAQERHLIELKEELFRETFKAQMHRVKLKISTAEKVREFLEIREAAAVALLGGAQKIEIIGHSLFPREENEARKLIEFEAAVEATDIEDLSAVQVDEDYFRGLIEFEAALGLKNILCSTDLQAHWT